MDRCTIFKNPSNSEFRALLGKLTTHTEIDPHGTMRGLINLDHGDVYIWDGYYAAHGGITDRYGLAGSAHLILDEKTVRVLTLWRYERHGFTYQDIHDIVSNNLHLKRMYRGQFDIIVNP